MYWRRRLVVLLVLVVVVAVVWILIAQPWRGWAATPTPTATGTPTPVPTLTVSAPTPTPTSTEPAVAEPCVGSDLTVEPVTDSTEYAADANPQLSIRLTNTGESDCTINVGTSAQVFTITSGNDTWWRSTDCQVEPSDSVVLLAAGQSVESAQPLAWDRTRSSVSTCDAQNRQRAPGGGATYWLDVEIGGVRSSSPAQIILY